MTSQIDPTLPVPGTPQTASVRDNFQIAHDEISALQAAAGDIIASEVAVAPAIGALGATVQAALTTLNNTTAPLASPTFTGDPRAPTAAPGDSDTSIASTAFVQAAVAPALANVGRNLIHNSLFSIAQRGTGPWSTAPTYGLDRWAQNFVGGTLSTSQITLADADRAAIGDETAVHAAQCAVTGGAPAASYTVLYQAIEGVRRLAGKTATVSFWARAAAGAPRIGVSLDQNFGTGGSPSAGVRGTGQAVAIGTVWGRYALTFAIPSATGKTLGANADDSTALNLWLSAGSTDNAFSGGIGVQSGTLSIWGVQLEIGAVATPLEKPDPQQDLAKCQRFYSTGGVTGGSTMTAGQTLYVPGSVSTGMRATPTMVITNNASTNLAAPAAVAFNGRDFFVYGAASASGAANVSVQYTASADL